MILSTTNDVCGYKCTEHVGFVRGTSIRSSHLGRDLLASMRGLVGGEISEMTKVMAEAREQALDRMVSEAKRMGANGIIGIRVTSAEVMSGAAEILCYGTAVKLEAV